MLLTGLGLCSARAPIELTALSAAADDLGSNELNFMNSTRGLHTPNLDQLAFGGVTLRNCESEASSARCATASAPARC